jgi:glycyl-radical enzyme activating protein family
MACVEICPRSAVSLGAEGPRINRDMCTHCFKCTDKCYAASKYKIGRDYDIEELFKLIEGDRIFYSIKGGGVTFSGGEPLTHPQYLTEISKICRERGINVAVESCGLGNYDEFKLALPFIDSMFLDIKHINSQEHRALTGSGNSLILENIRRIAQSDIKITIRTPIIPGLNDSIENLTGIAEFLQSLPSVREYELLAYHQLGTSKYAALGRQYPLNDIEPPSDEKMRELVKCVNEVWKDDDKVCFYTKDNNREIVR